MIAVWYESPQGPCAIPDELVQGCGLIRDAGNATMLYDAEFVARGGERLSLPVAAQLCDRARDQVYVLCQLHAHDAVPVWVPVEFAELRPNDRHATVLLPPAPLPPS